MYLVVLLDITEKVDCYKKDNVLLGLQDSMDNNLIVLIIDKDIGTIFGTSIHLIVDTLPYNLVDIVDGLRITLEKGIGKGMALHIFMNLGMFDSIDVVDHLIDVVHIL